MTTRFLAVLALLLLPLCSAMAAPPLPFLTGADLSELPCHEAQGIKYYDHGKAEDLLEIARQNGWNVVRVRLWVNPTDTPQAQVSSLDSVTALGRRIKAKHLRFLLDIHYSDTWADPGHQKKPAAWDGLTFPQLVAQTRDYTRLVIMHLRQNNALPDMVQIGNEIKNGLLYGSGTNGAGPEPGGGFWEHAPGGEGRAVQLLAAGLQGLRDGAKPAPAPLSILHIPDGQDTAFVQCYFHDLQAAEDAQNIHLDFDIIGLSYYPAHPWDKNLGYPGWTLDHLSATMNYIATTLHRPVLIVETGWPHDGTPDAGAQGAPQFLFTPDGQAAYYQALLAAVHALPGHLGLGVIPWDQDTLNWDSVFDAQGNALPAVRVLGGH